MPADTSSPMVKRKLQVPLFYKIMFATDEEALRATQELDGSVLGGETLRVTDSTRSFDPFVNVQGVPRHVSEEELRNHFELVGPIQRIIRFEDTLFGEVRFKTADEAWNAKVELDGSELYDKILRVELDCSTDHMNKVLVHGINPGAGWQELKDHFKQAGDIVFATIHGGHTVRVLFEKSEAARMAIKRLNRSKLRGTTDKISVTLPFEGTEDSAEIRVRGLPFDVEVDEVISHFEECGKILDVKIEVLEPLPPEFCVE